MTGAFGSQMNQLRRALLKFPIAVERGGAKALEDIKDDWIIESRDIAPLDTGNLRRQIDGQVGDNKLVISANAVNAKHFNYAYYIHEESPGSFTLKTPGTVKKYLDESAESRQDEWLTWIEEEISAELKRYGVIVSWQ